MNYILTVSPKGQITLPVSERKKNNHKKYLLEVHGNTFVLKPIELKIISDELSDFSSLGSQSFDIWDNTEDDLYQEFYNNL